MASGGACDRQALFGTYNRKQTARSELMGNAEKFLQDPWSSPFDRKKKGGRAFLSNSGSAHRWHDPDILLTCPPETNPDGC